LLLQSIKSNSIQLLTKKVTPIFVDEKVYVPVKLPAKPVDTPHTIKQKTDGKVTTF